MKPFVIPTETNENNKAVILADTYVRLQDLYVGR